MTSQAKAYQRAPEPGNPARSEAWALLEAARQINQTKDGPMDEFRAALRANWRLWTIFQASLLEPECALPSELRGNLLGLANFVDRTTVDLLAEREAGKVAALLNINRQISEGLLDGARANAKRNDAQPVSAPAANSSSVRQSA